ncbi:MAG: hypothetical protein KatS3mg076_0518 [Candidatus Binatia bacterium]|nr:MAG: hypothetical protein KatS3mg076_0518 [Candidatus Binatia bacterium]
MNRRAFLKRLATTVLGVGLAPSALAEVLPASHGPSSSSSPDLLDRHIRDYLYKMRHFDEPHPDDIVLPEEELPLLRACVEKLERLQRTVGHGNFQILSFDEALRFARRYSQVGEFSRVEVAFLERIFYADASRYGFFGEKPVKEITDRIPPREVVKIPRTGNYLYRGTAQERYEQIRKEIGEEVILTSGVRSVIKQFLLFLRKAADNRGNLSLASRSLAPPGFSYHGVGDFDVGQVGLGAANFTEKFVSTPVYRKLKELGYLDLRYPEGNFLGVRFEPWHIKMQPHV